MKYKVTEKGCVVLIKEYGSMLYIPINREDIPWVAKNLGIQYPSAIRAYGCMSITYTHSRVTINRVGEIKSRICVNVKDVKRLIKQLEKVDVTK